jgi:hypothetical protein
MAFKPNPEVLKILADEYGVTYRKARRWIMEAHRLGFTDEASGNPPPPVSDDVGGLEKKGI